MTNDMDAQFLCKDCARFNQCKYYDRRKGDSYICKYFHLTGTYGMTNGEVIKALFPNMGVHVLTEDDETIYEVDIDDDNYMSFTEKFWNSPYKGVSE